MSEGPVKAIGDRIRTIRSDASLSQRQLAELLKVSPGYLSDIENGKTNVNAEILTGIASAFPAVSTRWLLTGSGAIHLSRARSYWGEGFAIERVNHALDIEGLDYALGRFFSLLGAAPGKERSQIFERAAALLSGEYLSYMTHYEGAKGTGQQEDAARAYARTNAEREVASLLEDHLSDD